MHEFAKLLMAFLLCCCVELLVANENTYIRDNNTDLSAKFRQNSGILMVENFTSGCLVACLKKCEHNPSCMSAVYSTANNMCRLFNNSYCYGDDTVTAVGVFLYGKMVNYSNYAFTILKPRAQLLKQELAGCKVTFKLF